MKLSSMRCYIYIYMQPTVSRNRSAREPGSTRCRFQARPERLFRPRTRSSLGSTQTPLLRTRPSATDCFFSAAGSASSGNRSLRLCVASKMLETVDNVLTRFNLTSLREKFKKTTTVCLWKKKKKQFWKLFFSLKRKWFLVINLLFMLYFFCSKNIKLFSFDSFYWISLLHT